MSSGSYFTLYRKNEKAKVGQDVIKALEEEYYKSNKDGLFNNKDDNALRADIPMLMCSSFTAADDIGEKNANGSKFVFYDKDGIRYDKLLEFSFCSTFSGLKKKLDLDPYSYKRASKIISKDEAKKILQAIEYVLSGNYSKKFESILRNEYIEALGNGYSPFDKRFNKVPNSVYIDKEGDGYIVNFGDALSDAEAAEEDDGMEFSLNQAKTALLAFLDADEDTYDGEHLVLEYTAYA